MGPGPVTILRSQVVEPGDAAPPAGVPFVPEDNFDQPLSPGMKALVRGEAFNLVNTTNLSDEAELTRVLDNIARLQELSPKLTELRDKLKVQREAREAQDLAFLEDQIRLQYETPDERATRLAAERDARLEAVKAEYEARRQPA